MSGGHQLAGWESNSWERRVWTSAERTREDLYSYCHQIVPSSWWCTRSLSLVYQCCGNVWTCKLEGSRISKYRRRNNRSFYRRRPLPGEDICYSTICRWTVVHSRVTNFLFIRWIIRTKRKRPQRVTFKLQRLLFVYQRLLFVCQ